MGSRTFLLEIFPDSPSLHHSPHFPEVSSVYIILQHSLIIMYVKMSSLKLYFMFLFAIMFKAVLNRSQLFSKDLPYQMYKTALEYQAHD